MTRNAFEYEDLWNGLTWSQQEILKTLSHGPSTIGQKARAALTLEALGLIIRTGELGSPWKITVFGRGLITVGDLSSKSVGVVGFSDHQLRENFAKADRPCGGKTIN